MCCAELSVCVLVCRCVGALCVKPALSSTVLFMCSWGGGGGGGDGGREVGDVAYEKGKVGKRSNLMNGVHLLSKYITGN